ncbi:uncharacterized protein LOC135486745 [Lineus longissimus]|uniref:uncharacterized protein LOC135486745 n=1 Tax=Lineus longissimus TaxID=88925 RepID=UPI00315C55B7
MLGQGGLRLTKFISNSLEVLSAIPEENRAIGCKDLIIGSPPLERALGVSWNVASDTLSVKVGEMDKPNTRRGCLAAVNSLYDPLGLVGPVTLPAKRILQMTTKLSLSWDEPLPEVILHSWLRWKESLKKLGQLSIPRCYFSEPESAHIELHHFADASEVGYGTVTYLRQVSASGNINCSMVMAKGRTAPSVFVTVPRLELQAAVVAARVDCLIRKEMKLEVSRAVFWTDSRITLQYMYNECRRFKTYVANRVTEIRDTTSPTQWRHVPGKDNPADDISRGQTVEAFLKSPRWFQGPKFLIQPKENWPAAEVKPLEGNDPEVREEKVVGLLLTSSTSLDNMIARCSSWIGLQRRVALLLKFADMIRKEDRPKLDMDRAAKSIVMYTQRGFYAEEIADLKSNGKVKQSSQLRLLNPVLVDGVLRVGGRLSRAPTPFDARYPMIIPGGTHLSSVLIHHYHQTTAHAGQEHVLAALREKFWIHRARISVKKIIRSCIGCRRRLASRLTQKMADLPAMRLVAYEPPFSRTGLDYFGPLIVKRGRSELKRWGAIFTCLNVRAVHLEVVESLDASSFINALRRFLGRRGDPKDIWSDNGTNFTGGERELREALQHWNAQNVDDELAQRGISWHFQPPAASHMSGVYEQLVKSVKLALKALLGQALVSDEVLATTLVEVERVLNSRPLCKVSDDPKDDEVLTPSHFLLQKPCTSLPPGLFVKEDAYHRKRWKHCQLLAQHFWKRWLKEYLPALQERSKWHQKMRNVSEGDLVMNADDDSPWGQWPLARVSRTFTGDDGQVRVAEVKTKTSTLVRLIHKLCMLEASNEDLT